MDPELDTDNAETNDEVIDSVSSDVADAYASLESADEENNDDTESDGSDTDVVDDPGADDTSSQGDDEQSSQNDEAEENDDQSHDDDDSTETDETEKASAPDHWTDADKDMYSKQSPEAQEFLMRRHKEMEAGFTHKTQENAEFLKTYEPVNQVMAPFKNAMQQAGLSEGQVIARWAAAENMLNTQPENAIKALAQTYKVDLTALAGSQGGSPDPYTTDQGNGENGQNNQVINDLQQQVSSLSQSFMTQAQQDAVGKIEAFANEADDQGNLKRPHFKELEGDIAQLAAVARSQGKPIDLQTFYEQAAWSNPATREKLMSSQRSAEESNRKEQDRKRADAKRSKADKAKRASRTVRSSTDVNSSGGGDGNKNASLGMDVASAYDKLESSGRV